jgi:phosphopentomutase
MQEQERRAIVIVLDGCGAGAAPDAALFGDEDNPATVRHVWDFVGGFHAPNLAKYGFLKACGIDREPSCGAYGRLQELSAGKDSVVGHWEMMGIITEKPFPTYPNGFPPELIHAFEQAIGTHTLGNRAVSGTIILNELGAQHMQTGYPIVYTSADSVFQIACHEDIVSLERLYEMCRIARKLCGQPYNIQRVIARPFTGSPETGFTRTPNRKDFPLSPPTNLVDEIGNVFGIGVIPELFNGRGFREVRRTQKNAEHAEMLFEALQSDTRFIFANFEDFDMLYGHRNNPRGFALCLEEFDITLDKIIKQLRPHDLLILTADHGNDPTTPSTDHSREYVPVSIVSSYSPPIYLGGIKGMNAIGATVANYLGIPWDKGENLLSKLPFTP